MTKRFFLTAAVALLFTACAKDEVDVVTPNPNQGPGKVTIGASFEANATKSDIDDNGNFTWSTADGIKVYSNTNYWSVLDIVDGESAQELGPKFEFANFTTSAFQGDYISKAAVFPKTITPAYSNDALSLTLPSEIAWNDSSLDDLTVRTMQADNVMVALGFADGASTVDFKNVGGLFRLTLNNVPVGATKLEFITQQKINGTFDVITEENNVQLENPYIATSNTYAEGENIITINFETLTAPTKMVFFIPVPVGSYQIGFAVKDGEDNIKWQFHSTATNSVERAHMIKMPTLSHITVGGGGEGATNIIVTPTAYSGTVNLPSTQNNIYVKMNETDGEINLEYSTAANAAHPANVYLQALGDVNTLNINLPDSHVELTGNGNDVQIVTNVTASTTINTFVVDNKVQIGKTIENESVGGLTINGGSLDLSAKVEGPVTVVYDVVAETVNKTSEKVSININSAIKDLVVTSASTQSAPDKIYVTLSASSKVNETLSVPETNCNLYIAPGAQAKTVTTKAAENTIAGAIEHLAAEGDGTSVVVEKQGSVTESITSSDKASVVIVERTDAEVAAQTAGAITANTTTSTQGTIDTVEAEAVAMIESNSYASLEVAFAAVADGQTIKLISDVNLGSTPFVVSLDEKNVTLNLGGKTLTGRTNLTSGNLTLQNGNVVNTDGQPLNVYGSDTQGAQNYSVLSVARDVTVTGKYGVCVFGKAASTNGYGAVVNVEGKLIANNGIFVSGNLGNNVAADMNNIVNISGTLTSESDVAVALNGWATVNVQSGAKITGNTGIAVKRGVLNVYDGATVTANGQWVTPPAANNNGTEPTGAAVSMTNTYNNYGAMAVNIAGGSFTSANGEALYKANQTYSNAATFTVTGGSFSSDPTAFVADGYDAVKNGNVWTVQPNDYVAKIGSDYYTSLDAAIDAAQANETVTLIKDVVLSESLVIAEDKNLTLDLGTHSISGEVGASTTAQSMAGKLIINNGNLTINSSNNQGRIWNNGSDAQGRDAIYNAEGATIVIYGGIFGDSDTDMTNGNNINRGLALRNYGTATINGGLFTAGDNYLNSGWAYAVINAGTSTLTINGGTVYGKNNGNIGATSGELIVNGGTFKIDGPKSHYNIYAAGGNVTVNNGTFTKSDYVSNGNPCSFYAASNGQIVINNGTFNNLTNSVFKSGTGTVSVTGGTFNKQPEAAIIADGYAATQTGDVWTVEQKKVAQIGEVKYASLPAAIEAALGYDTVTLIDDVVLTEILVIDEAKHITLDLGTYSISGNVAGYLLRNHGTLTINASSTNPGKIYNVSIAAKGHGAVLNEGGITINGGIFGDDDTDPTNTGTVNSGCALRNRGTATVNGGVFTTAEPDYPGSVWAYAIVSGESDTPASITFNGGHVYGKHGDICNNHGTLVINDVTTYGTAEYYSVYAWKNGTSTVKGGTFVKNSHPKASIGYQFYADESSANIIVEGGNFTNNTNANFGSGSGKVELKGGTYNKQPEAGIIAPGYHAVQNGNTWTVEEMCLTVGVGGQYETLAAAIAAANSGDVIKLVSDLSVSSETSLSKSFTLDLNGNTINSSSVLFNIYDSSVELTIKDSGENGGIDVSADKVIYISSGKVTLKSGAISAHSTSSHTYGISVGSSGNFVMDGGSITIPSTSTSNYNYCVGSYGNLTINGGYLEAHANGGNYAINTTGGSATINGGSVVAYAYPAGFKSPYVLNGSGAKAVYGGYFKAFGDSATYSAGYLVDGTATIYAGYFGGNYYYGVTNYVSEDSTLRELTTSETDPTHAAAKAAGYEFVVERSLEITGPGIENGDDNE